MFHEGKDLVSLFGGLETPAGFPDNFTGFAGTGRSLIGKPRTSGQVVSGISVPIAKVVDKELSGGLRPGEIGFEDPGGD